MKEKALLNVQLIGLGQGSMQSNIFISVSC